MIIILCLVWAIAMTIAFAEEKKKNAVLATGGPCNPRYPGRHEFYVSGAIQDVAEGVAGNATKLEKIDTTLEAKLPEILNAIRNIDLGDVDLSNLSNLNSVIKYLSD